MSELIRFIEVAFKAQSNEDPQVAFAPEWITSALPGETVKIPPGDLKGHPVNVKILPHQLLLTKVVKVPKGLYQVRSIEQGITTRYPTTNKDKINILSSDQVTIIDSVERERAFGLVNLTIIPDS